MKQIIIHIWKILHECCPNDFNLRFSEHSRNGIKAIVPSIVSSSSCRNQTLYDNSFGVRGPRLWNCIPSYLHVITDQEQFKFQLTDYLKTLPDNPPTSGYSCVNGNSVLDWSMNKVAAMLQGLSDKLMTQ